MSRAVAWACPSSSLCACAAITLLLTLTLTLLLTLTLTLLLHQSSRTMMLEAEDDVTRVLQGRAP